ncbi:YbjN domain-containing protein [bacterium]|nr:YbjN domain-containing protein [bacterium]
MVLEQGGNMRAMLLTAMVLMVLGCATAQAQDVIESAPDVIDSINALEVRAVLQELGFASIEIDEDDDVIVKMLGYNVLILVGSYNNTSLQMNFAVSGTEADLDMVNNWNRTKRYSTASIDGDGDPVLESDLDLAGGVTMARVQDFILTYYMLLEAFLDEL